MKLEEVIQNIGENVEIDKSTKPYGDKFGSFSNDFCEMIENDKSLKISKVGLGNVFITHKSAEICGEFLIEAKHLKLKHQNCKMYIPTGKEDIKAQQLFFDSHSNTETNLALLRNKVKDMRNKVKGEFQNFESRTEMTWEDAFQALIDGKEVEMLDSHNQWENLKDFYIRFAYIMEKANNFRIAPKRISLNGNFTEGELLEKIEELKNK